MPRRSRAASTKRDDTPPATLPVSGNVKLQRWIDLLAALLSRSLPATFEELARSVPEYDAKLRAAEEEPDAARRRTMEESLKRTFERDKDELRAFGVPIESLPDEQGNDSGTYVLRRKDFYLPYLCLAGSAGGDREPRRETHWQYRSLTQLSFDSDELQAVVDAAARVRSLGDPLLTADVDSALRKLAVDLPVDATNASPDEPRLVLPRTRHDAAVFDALSDALLRRKHATFTYHAMSSDRTEPRDVEPWGLFFLDGHWYLAARDRTRADADIRNFRLDRMSEVQVNGRKPQTPDFDIPSSFRLRDHARSRQAWELGDAEPVTATVRFTGTSGPTIAASKLGGAVAGHDDRRDFTVRRPDAFVRWLLSFAGEVVPLAPAEIVSRYGREVARTAEVYTREAPANPVAVSRPRAAAAAEARSGERWQPKGAAAQLRRILHVVPEIADGEEHSLAKVAESIGADTDTLRRDLYSLVARYDAPGGFVEGVQLFVEPDRVSALTNHFRRPMRLTSAELCALELGLAVLRAHRNPAEHAAIDRARARLRAVIAELPDDPVRDGIYAASLGDAGGTTHLDAARTALRDGRKLRLVYRKSGATEATERVVCPCALVAASGMFYLVAQCDPGAGIRVFRMDRVEGADALDERFELAPGFSLDDVLREGRVFLADAPATMVVRYSPRIARWIAEREGLALDADGGLVMEHPLADAEWAVRHVLQYGPDAEVLQPPALRDRISSRLAEVQRGLD